MSTLDIPTPRAFMPLIPAWEDRKGARFIGARGGRGGAKSHFFGGLLVDDILSTHIRAACVREVQASIKDSVKQLIEDKINHFGVRPSFKITEREIVFPETDSLVIFRGLQNHTAASIKSLEGFNRVWYEEGQSLSKRSIELAVPTFRVPGTQQWFSWDPDQDTDPVDTLFRENKNDPDFVCVEVNYYDNPWLPDDLRKDMERDQRRDPDKHAHVWLGGYRRNSEAAVFRNLKIEPFETPTDAQFFLGGDWGFSIDPTALIRMFIKGRTLFIDREVYQIGCEIDRTPALFDQIDPEWTPEHARDPRWTSIARKLPIVADSARPETISYMRNHGFPRIAGAIKGKGSVEDGIEFLKSYDIVVHPRCVHAATEFKLYSFKIDKKSGVVTNELQDTKNHTIDSARYALEGVRRRTVSSQSSLGV